MKDELQQLEEEISALEQKLRAVGDHYKNTEAMEYGEAKADFLLAEAREKYRLYEEGKKDPDKKLTDEMKKAAALLACEEELKRFHSTQAAFIASKEVLRALQSELSGKQTRVGLWKADWGLAGRQDAYNQPPENPNWADNVTQLQEPEHFSGPDIDDDDEGGEIKF